VHGLGARLTTRSIDQALAALPEDPQGREHRRRSVLEGGYRIVESGTPPVVALVGMGAVMPEVLAAATALERDGVACDVVCLTSADLVFRAFQARRGLADWPTDVLERLFPAARAAPVVTVVDGHPHTLAFLGAINSVPAACLGVSDFGQVGEVEDLYRIFGIDESTIIGAAWDLIDEVGAQPAPRSSRGD
jgi:pyruvate dehydrogenase E1 component